MRNHLYASFNSLFPCAHPSTPCHIYISLHSCPRHIYHHTVHILIVFEIWVYELVEVVWIVGGWIGIREWIVLEWIWKRIGWSCMNCEVRCNLNCVVWCYKNSTSTISPLFPCPHYRPFPTFNTLIILFSLSVNLSIIILNILTILNMPLSSLP